MPQYQEGILAPIPAAARYLIFDNVPGGTPEAALCALAELADGRDVVVGLGRSLVDLLGRRIDGLVPFPALVGPGVDVPATPGALWCWLRGEDRGDLVHRTRQIEAEVADGFRLVDVVDAFRHGTGLDLTGYEDGTENPTEDDALAAAFVDGRGEGEDGASFVAVQQWVHDLDTFEAMAPDRQDEVIGRRLSDNTEMDDAPPSAHVKRTEQEYFTPHAHVLRRSMPWAEGQGAGLNFVAFGASFYAFDAQLRRMVGQEDGVVDALFEFSSPTTGCYFWCPPMKDDGLNLSALGIG